MKNDERKFAQRGVLFQGLLLLLSLIGLYFLRSELLRGLAYGLLGVSCACNMLLYGKFLILKVNSFPLKINTCISLLGNIVICFFVFRNRLMLYQYGHPLIVKGGFGAILVCSILEITYFFRVVFKNITREKILLGVCFLCVGMAFVKINTSIFGMWIRWDSYAYLFDFYKLSPEGIFAFDGMHVAQHLTSAYGLLAVGFHSVFGGDMRIVLCILNIMFMYGDLILFYLIFRSYTPSTNPFNSLLYAVAFSLSPYVFGMTSSFSLEMFMLFALLIFIYGNITENDYLLVLGAFMLCNSKETGVVITCGIMLARIIRDTLRYYRDREISLDFGINSAPKVERLREYLRSINAPICMAVLILGLFWCEEFIGGNWISTNNGEMYTVDGSVFNAIGFSVVYIVSKFKTLFLANFNWLVAMFIAILLIGSVFIHKKNNSHIKTALSQSIVPFSALVSCGIFSLLFITYNHFRYWTPVIGPLYLLFYIFLHNLINSKKLHTCIALAVGVVLCMQSFVTVDPVMLASFGQIETGTKKIVSAEDSVIGREEPVFLDSSCYNHQIMFFDEAFDKLLAEVGFDKDNSAIIVTDRLYCPTVGGSIGSLHMLNGFGYQYMDVPRYIGWNTTIQRRELSINPIDAISISYYSPVNDPNLVERLRESYDNIYYIELPWCGKEDVDDIKDRYGIDQCTEIMHNGWELRAHKF